MAIISLTMLKLNSVLTLPRFFSLTASARRAALASDGLIELKTNGFWYLRMATMSLWRDQQTLMNFVYCDAHKQAITAMPSIAVGRTYHYEGEALPTWDEALLLLESRGRVY